MNQCPIFASSLSKIYVRESIKTLKEYLSNGWEITAGLTNSGIFKERSYRLTIQKDVEKKMFYWENLHHTQAKQINKIIQNG